MSPNSIWALPSVELMQHAGEHLQREHPRDFRIALLSIDNALDAALSAYLEVVAPEDPTVASQLPRTPPRVFPERLALVETVAPKVFTQGELMDIEYYHRLRNQLYHQGVGGGADKATAVAYFNLAQRAIEELLGARVEPKKSRLRDLTSEARAAIEQEIKHKLAEAHGAKTREGAERAKRRGLAGTRGKPINGVRPDEIAKLIELHRAGKSYKVIAAQLTTRRLKRGENRELATIAWQKVRRKLVSLGMVPSG